MLCVPMQWHSDNNMALKSSLFTFLLHLDVHERWNLNCIYCSDDITGDGTAAWNAHVYIPASLSSSSESHQTLSLVQYIATACWIQRGKVSLGLVVF